MSGHTIGGVERPPGLTGNAYGMADESLVVPMRTKRRLGYNEAIGDVLHIFAQMESAMKLNIDVKNDFLDAVSNLKEKE